MSDYKTHDLRDGLAALVSDIASDVRRRVVEEPWFGKPLDGGIGEQSKLAGWGPADDDTGKFGPLPQSEWDADALSPFAVDYHPNHFLTGAEEPLRIEADELLRLEGPKEEPPAHDHGISP